MFYGVILCNTLVVFFAACGVANVVECLGKIDTSMGYPIFLRGLALAAWPLVVAGVLFMLVQIACQVQQLVLEQRAMAFAPASKGHESDHDRRETGTARTETTPKPKPKSAGAPTPTECVAQVSAAAQSTPSYERVAPKLPVNFFDISDAVVPPSPKPSAQAQPVSQASAVAAAAPQIVAPTVPKLPDEERKTHFFSLD